MKMLRGEQIHAINYDIDIRKKKNGSGRGTRTPDTWIMIPLL